MNYRISGSLLRMHTAYKNTPLLAKANFLNESFYNCFSHEATTAWVVTIELAENEWYFCVLHNGTSFGPYKNMEVATHFNVSGDDTGIHGCGGKLAPLCLVRSPHEYKYYIRSDDFMIETTFQDSTVNNRDVTQELLPKIKKQLGSLYSKSNVAYMAKCNLYEKNGRFAMQSNDLMSLVTDSSPYWTDNREIKYLFDKAIGLNEQYDKIIDSDTRPYKWLNCYTAQKYDDDFMLKSYKFNNIECCVKCYGHSINFLASVEYKIYPGLKHSSESSSGLIVINGKDRGWQRNFVAHPSYNSFLYRQCDSDKISDRLIKDPMYIGNELESAAGILNVNFTDRISDQKDMHKWHSRFGDIIDFHKKQKNSLRRMPYVKAYYFINKVTSVTNAGGENIKLPELTIRDYMGGSNEFFRVVEPNIASNIIKSILSGLKDNVYSSKGLDDMRQLALSIWPFNQKMAELPDGLDKIRTTWYVSSEQGKPIGHIDVDKPYYERMLDDKGVDIDPSLGPLTPYPSTSTSICRHHRGNKWLIQTCPLSKLNSDGTYSSVAQDVFLKTKATHTLPHQRMDFSLPNGDIISLNVKVNLPHRYEYTKPRKIEKKRGDEKLTNSMYADILPDDAIVNYTPGRLLLNRNHFLIKLLFPENLQKHSFQKKFYRLLKKEADKFYRDFICVMDCKYGGQDNEKATSIEKMWGGITSWQKYAINKHLEPMFYTRDIEAQKKEMRKWLDRNGSGSPHVEKCLVDIEDVSNGYL